MSLPCFDTLHEPSSWAYRHLVVRIISELMGHSTDPPFFPVSKGSGNGDRQTVALTAIYAVLVHFFPPLQGKWEWLDSSNFSWLLQPIQGVGGTGLLSNCFAKGTLHKCLKHRCQCHGKPYYVPWYKFAWYSWKWLAVFKLCGKFWILRLEVVSTNTIIAAYDMNRYSFMQTVPLSPFCLEVHQFQQASHAFSAGSLLHLWCFCRWLCSWRGCWSCVVAATIGGSRSSTDSRATTGHAGTVWIAGSGCQSGHWLWHWRKRLNCMVIA